MPTPTTREGYEKLRSEIEFLETVEMPRITNLLAEARAEGDLRENAEYHAQRENQGMLQAKINALKSKFADLYIVDPNSISKERVAFGTCVTVKDLDADIEEKYIFVGPGEEDYSSEVMKILCTSPMAEQLINHKVGDKIDVTTPGGVIHYEVMAIE